MALYAEEIEAELTQENDRLRAALAYVLPLAALALEAHRMERIRCGHNDITAAKKIANGHTDPGPNYPWATYIAQVNAILKATTATAVKP